MTDRDALDEAVRARDVLKTWLLTEAYPLWWRAGYDHARGGFHEKLNLDGTPARDAPRRARVQPRQVFSFAVAGELGWSGPWREVMQSGLDWYLTHYTRPDGMFRTLVSADGEPLDDKVDLYDQAFGLFALATAYQALGEPQILAERAAALRDRLKSVLGHPLAGFEESNPRTLPLLSNPHMHMFEASLAWAESRGDDDGRWRALADEIAGLSMSKFIDDKSGGLREFFNGDWNPAAGVSGRIVEPGHQFEWGWLLLRWAKLAKRPDAAKAARKMIDIGEGPGVDPSRAVAINQLLDDMSIYDPDARLWPQTERIKAFAQLARESGSADDWLGAVRGVQGLMKYFGDDLLPGLWRDRYLASGNFVLEPAPASSFYHIVCAVVELDRAVNHATA